MDAAARAPRTTTRGSRRGHLAPRGGGGRVRVARAVRNRRGPPFTSIHRGHLDGRAHSIPATLLPAGADDPKGESRDLW